MGYRFSIKNANAVGHLVEGNVLTFLDQMLTSSEILQPNIEFLDNLIHRPYEDFYTTNWKHFENKIGELRNEWESLRNELRNIESYKNQKINFPEHERLIRLLSRISNILSNFRVKTLLLPGFNHNFLNDFMIDRFILKELIHFYPEDSVLILQLKEQLNKEAGIEILNVFSKFNVGLQNVDQWPGILLWDNNDSLFVPIKHEKDIYNVYRMLHFERGNSLNYIRNYFNERNENEKFAYIFHLSDLHFGNKTAEKTKLRTIRILENQLNELENNARAIPIITGDLMDTPNKTNKQIYLEFVELLKAKGFDNPIHILGNHDYEKQGFLKFFTRQKAIISSLSNTTKIHIIEDLKLALIKFDSNTGGEFAQGKIGQDQLIEIGNEIDSLTNEDLTYIALLHHHPKEIENPDWYAENWYEAFLGRNGFEKTMKLIDAELFLDWINNRNIKFILHGHKHIPRIHKHNDINILAAGSSTGSVRHKDSNRTYLTYNLIKYNINEKRPVSCSIIAEEILGAGAKNILLMRL